jgi:hypothetical protein
MIIGNAERQKYEAHIQLAARHGYSSDFPLKVETTFYVPHLGSGANASVVEVPVSVEVPLRIMAEGDGIQRLGDVSWRDYHGYTDPFRTATYFVTEGDSPQVMRTPSRDRENKVSPAAADPFKLARWVVEQCSKDIADLSAVTAKELRDAAQAAAGKHIRDGMATSPLVVGRSGEVSMIRNADVPHYVVVPQKGKRPIDVARCDVVVDRNLDYEALDWRGLGLRFEPWEVAAVARVMLSYGLTDLDAIAPNAIGFADEVASDLAVVNRLSMNSLLPLFIKRVMLDLSSSTDGLADEVKEYTSVIYRTVATGEWGSQVLDDALSSLHELWRYDSRMSNFARSKGWDLKLSPFQIMSERVEAFPWRGAISSSDVKASPLVL